MDAKHAIEAMGALAQEHRMEIYRTLIKELPSGLSAGELSLRVKISPSSLSFHIAQLERAGLVRSRRVSRQIIYTVQIDSMGSLLKFLMEDCCNGEPEICSDLLHGIDQKGGSGRKRQNVRK